ncbi:MAG TPA: heme peroxidase family protein, partial [Nitrospiraceae bacterium]|nr:heme peroxidase family protein [Nitrospiraceae bacterium]
FLDHDITFDPTSSLERQQDPESISNFRTPAFELDSVYGSGRAASPHLYDQQSPGAMKLLVEEIPGTASLPQRFDLPRNSQNVAIIGDPRNDENLIVSQLHLAFLKFHNAVADRVQAGGITNPNDVFDEAQRLVRWHYQWIILHEFLPKTVGESLFQDILTKGRKIYNWHHQPFIPVEFSVAAYRFGHSQVRPGYRANFKGDSSNPFIKFIFDAGLPESTDPDDLRGGKRATRRFIDWGTFFDLGDGQTKPNKKIDTKLSAPLFHLPGPGTPQSLAQRNLLRHLTFSLPSGQRVAKAMSEEPLPPDDLSDLKPVGLENKTPLWFYILREADVKGDGKRLGPVGGRIVAEVFIGLLQGDKMSYLNQDPDWEPTLPTAGSAQDFKMADLLRFAGVVHPI